MRYLFVCFALFLSGVTPGQADDHSLYVAPGPRTIVGAANLSASQAEAAGNARKLGDLIGGSLKMGDIRATDVLVTTKCGRYQTALITFADGTVKSLSLSNAPATKTDLEKAKAAIPILRIEDLAGCNS